MRDLIIEKLAEIERTENIVILHAWNPAAVPGAFLPLTVTTMSASFMCARLSFI